MPSRASIPSDRKMKTLHIHNGASPLPPPPHKHTSPLNQLRETLIVEVRYFEVESQKYTLIQISLE